MLVRTCSLRAMLLVVVTTVLSACGASVTPSTPTPAKLSAPPPQPSLTLAPTFTPGSAQILSTPTLRSSGITIEPMVTAPRLLLYSWSPQSDFLAYWSFTQEEVAADYTYPPGTLNFLNISDGQSCSSLIPIGYPYSGASPIAWQPDGTILILTTGKALLGRPCQQDFIDVTSRFPGVLAVATVSPDNTAWLLSNEKGYSLYSPETQTLREITGTVGGSNAGYSWSPELSRLGITGVLDDAQAGTWVIDVVTGLVVDKIEWRYRSGEGHLAGPIWLSESQILIQSTADQGPLLVNVGQDVVPIAPALFDVSSKPDCPDSNGCDTFRVASGASLQDAQTFHITLFEAGDTPSPQKVLLHHSETGKVETLPASIADFSPDGRWLIMQSSISTAQGERFQIELRAADPLGSEAHILLDTASSSLPVWSADSRLLASSTLNGLTVFTIDGKQVGSWMAAGYALEPGLWSPNGKYLTIRAIPQSLTPPSQNEFLSVVQVR